MKKDRLITIVGPTASGKTALAVRLAKELGSLIISGDAYQVYRGLDIGTAKVTKEEAQGVPHALVDILDPTEPYSAALFQEKAAALIHEENEKGRIPIVAGGTGLYVQGLLEGYHFLPKGEGRNRYRALYEEKGAAGLWEELKKRGGDKAFAAIPTDPHRMIRELELLDEGTGREAAKKAEDLIYDGPVIGISMERARLYERINKRVDRMMAAGLKEEVRTLLAKGVPETAQSLRGIGYKEMIPVIQGTMTEAEGAALIKRNTRRFAKRQLTWFKRMPYIRWFDKIEHEDDMWYREIKTYVMSYFRGE